MALAYLLDPCQQYQNRAGVNNVAGYFEVFRMDTDDRATVYVDFNGTLAPEHIGIDNDGRAVMIVESGRPYRVEMHAPNGDLLWPVQPVWPVASGGGVSGTDIVSSDGSIVVDKSTVGSFTTYDLSSNVEDSTDLLNWIRCDGGINIAGTDIWKPTYSAGSMVVGNRGVRLDADQYYHVTARVRVNKSGAAAYYDDLQLLLKTDDGTTVSEVARKGVVVDASMGLYQDFEISADVLAGSDCELLLEITGKELDVINFQLLDMEVHRVYSGAPHLPPGTIRTEQADWTETDDTKSSFIKHKPDLSLYVTDSELDTILDGYATTQAMDTALAGKQNVLTAGSNIVIENDVISATAEPQLQANWNEGDSSSVQYIQNKPDLSVYATTQAMNTALAGKQDTISDLDAIRSGAQAGSTAVQPAALADYQEKLTAGSNITISGTTISATMPDLSQYVTDSELETILSGYATAQDLAGKQDVLTAGSGIDITNNVISCTAGFTQLPANWTEGDPQSVQYIQNKPDLTRYATTSDLTTGLAAKQDVLTPGSNVTIVGDTISATDTTYSAGNGLSLVNGEFAIDTSVVATKADLSGKQDTLSAGNGISISSNTVTAKVDGTSIDFNSDGELSVIGGSFTQLQANWNETDVQSVQYIQNKPSIPTVPTPKELVPGANISIVETTNNVTISATGVPTIGTVTV